MSNKQPREEAEDITKGNTEPHHIGKHTPETLTQELFSLQNTKQAFRGKKWLARYDEIVQEIDNIKDKKIKNRIRNKAQAMLQGGES